MVFEDQDPYVPVLTQAKRRPTKREREKKKKVPETRTGVGGVENVGLWRLVGLQKEEKRSPRTPEEIRRLGFRILFGVNT